MNKQLQEAWAIVTADRKKAAVLGALVLVAGGLWLRAALTSGPSKASASGESRMTESGKKRAEKAAKKPEDVVERAPARTIELAPPPPLTRDLFVLSEALLASSAQTDLVDSGDPKSAAGKDDKPLRPAPIAAQTVSERVASEAARLRLRSTMIGANPIAVIETPDASRAGGVMVRPGEAIAGFTLVAVRAHEVELEKEGVRVTIARTN